MKLIQINDSTQINPADVSTVNQGTDKQSPLVEWGPHNQRTETPRSDIFWVSLKMMDGRVYRIENNLARNALKILQEAEGK